MKWVFIGITALFAFSSVNGAINGKGVINQNTFLFFIFLFATIGYFIYKNKHVVFDAWLEENGNVILDRGLDYKGTIIDKDTKLSRFYLVVSIVAFSFKVPSRLYIVGHDNHRLLGVIYGLLSGIFGWWGIPWGPIWTIESLAKNFSGGQLLTVEEYFNPREDEPFNLFSKSGVALIIFILIIVSLLAVITTN
jgi:hypothetical protein